MRKIIVVISALLLLLPAIAQNNEFTKFEKNGKWGVKNSQGKVIVKPKYKNIARFEHGFAIVDMSKVRKARALVSYEKNARYSSQTFAVYDLQLEKFGCVDLATGKEVVPAKYGKIMIFENNLIAAKKAFSPYNGWINFDYKGNKIKPTKYAEFEVEKNGLICVKSPDEKTGYLDASGNEIIPTIYKSVEWCNDTGDYIKVNLDGKFGLLDAKTYKEILPAEYSVINPYHEGYTTVKKDEKWGVIDENCNVTVPLVYDNYYGSFNGQLGLGKNGNVGVVDFNNNIILPLIYEGAYPFSEGLAGIKKDGKWGFIDKNGNEVIPFIYDDISFQFKNRRVIHGFLNGKVMVTKGNEKFVINTKGEVVTDSNK